MTDDKPHKSLYEALFDRGFGELPLMREKDGKILLGNLVMDKGRLAFKDRGLLQGLPLTNVATCFDLGIIGAIADVSGNEWESLTFLGADRCKIPVDLSSTRHRVLGGISGNTGENLLSFYGSVYRGFQLLLDSNLLPVVLPVRLQTENGLTGLAVADFRFATAPLPVVSKVYDLVRASVDRNLTLSVEEVDINDSDFEAMFGNFTHE